MNGITYEEFEQHLLSVKDMMEFQDEFTALVSRHGGDCFMLPSMIDGMVNLLELITKDRDEWIEYYIYELDFGKKYIRGDIVDENGNIIELITIQDLWDLLSKETEQNGTN